MIECRTSKGKRIITFNQERALELALENDTGDIMETLEINVFEKPKARRNSFVVVDRISNKVLDKGSLIYCANIHKSDTSGTKLYHMLFHKLLPLNSQELEIVSSIITE